MAFKLNTEITGKTWYDIAEALEAILQGVRDEEVGATCAAVSPDKTSGYSYSYSVTET